MNLFRHIAAWINIKRAAWKPPIWWLLWKYRREVEGKKFWVLMIADGGDCPNGFQVNEINLTPYEARLHLFPFTYGGAHILRIEYGVFTAHDLAYLRQHGVSI